MISSQPATAETPVFAHDREPREIELMEGGKKEEVRMLANDALLRDSGKSVNTADESMAVVEL